MTQFGCHDDRTAKPYPNSPALPTRNTAMKSLPSPFSHSNSSPGQRFAAALCTRLVVAVLCLACVGLAPAKGWCSAIRLLGFEYAPFYQIHEANLEGIAVDLALELFPRLELQPELAIFPLKRALDMLREGQADGTMILIRTAEREKYLLFTEPVMTVRGLIWYLADRDTGAVRFDTLEDLKRDRIGVTRGYSYGAEFDELLKSMNVDVANTDYSSYLKLTQGRIDIFPGNEIVAEGLFKKHPELRGKLAHSDKSFIEWDLCIAISRKSEYAPLLPEINAALQALKREGAIDRIVEKYTH